MSTIDTILKLQPSDKVLIDNWLSFLVTRIYWDEHDNMLIDGNCLEYQDLPITIEVSDINSIIIVKQ